MFYAALDVSLRSVAICIIDHHGKICLERSVRSDVSDVLLGLAGFDQPIHQVGFEAGALTQPITYGLTEAGYDVVCMEARQVAAALSAMRNKTDKHDARGIAQILRSGWPGTLRAPGSSSGVAARAFLAAAGKRSNVGRKEIMLFRPGREQAARRVWFYLAADRRQAGFQRKAVDRIAPVNRPVGQEHIGLHRGRDRRRMPEPGQDYDRPLEVV